MKNQKQQAKVNNNSRNLWLVVAAVAVFGGIAWYSLRPAETASVPAQESREQQALPAKTPTLSPLMFTGKTREAYQVALDIPEVLKEVQCYCGCKALGHQSNYFCFTDEHGAGCQMCQDIALDSKRMHDSGLPTSQIKEAIRIKYEHMEQ